MLRFPRMGVFAVGAAGLSSRFLGTTQPGPGIRFTWLRLSLGMRGLWEDFWMEGQRQDGASWGQRNSEGNTTGGAQPAPPLSLGVA